MFCFRYEERFGGHDLPWKKWVIFMEKEEKGGRKRRKKITFQSIVRRILVGRSIKAGIEGSMKGKLLMKADLPRDLELEVANQIECSLPARRRTSSLKGKLMAHMGMPSTSTVTAPCDESRGATLLIHHP